MAKAATAKTEIDKKKNKKATAAAVPIKAKKAKAPKAAKPAKPAKAEKKSSRARDGFDGLAKLAEHPLVADLLAAGAIAAVAAIAEHQMGNRKGETSSKMVKSAGKAAAAAMGKKLMGTFGEIGEAATDAVKKG